MHDMHPVAHECGRCNVPPTKYGCSNDNLYLFSRGIASAGRWDIKIRYSHTPAAACCSECCSEMATSACRFLQRWLSFQRSCSKRQRPGSGSSTTSNHIPHLTQEATLRHWRSLKPLYGTCVSSTPASTSSSNEQRRQVQTRSKRPNGYQ